ncbi:porin [Caulobacter sp. 17J65-9]|uniref:porin n=1 Tax=Caulobacter sp. 17J65-9 TaxID=2709382 RepID=UPI0013C65888|nr:porin [Caulobacter sp. 17J65-9]NEX93121.1 outer membrane beta-barrel protein [Caulobacter sp. 17J65-9]
MKNVLFASAALAVVALAAPAFAQDASGYVGGSYAKTDTDFGDADTWGLDGAVAFSATDKLGVQIDAGYANTDVDGFDSSDAYNANVHLFTRNDAWAVGGFAGVTDAEDSTTWNIGAEGAKYLDNVTLAGAVAYANNDDADVDVWGIGGEARYFVSDNFRLNGGLSYADADVEKAWTVGLGGEYQFAATPVSLYAGYEHTKFDEADIDADKFTVGVRYNFGGQTLKGRDRSGASFNGAKTAFGGLF